MTLSYKGRKPTPLTPQTPQSAREDRAAANRERCPEAAKIVDAFRQVFGADVQVVYVKEGDVVLDRRVPK